MKLHRFKNNLNAIKELNKFMTDIEFNFGQHRVNGFEDKFSFCQHGDHVAFNFNLQVAKKGRNIQNWGGFFMFRPLLEKLTVYGYRSGNL